MTADPEMFGDYVIRGRLGAGGMGVVHLAEAPGGTLVALKIMRPELADDPGFRSRFAREVSAVRAVEGPHTVQVLEAGTDGDRPYLVTEYVDGPSLADRIAEGPLPTEEVLSLARSLAVALADIHAAGVAHRDLKPSNVLLGPDGPKVIDFGIAQIADATALTRTGMVVGTPGYLAPEQVLGQAGQPADVFSWALTVTHAATGRPPFGTGPADAVMYRVLNTAPDLDGLPIQLRTAVHAAVRKNPAERPPAASLVGLLERDDEPTAPYTAASMRHTHSDASVARKRRVWPLVTAVALLIAGGTAIASYEVTAAGTRSRAGAHPTTHATARGARTASDASAATKVLTFSPWGIGNSSGGPAPGVRVAAVRHGTCTGGSTFGSRGDAYACSDDDYTRLDPCLADPVSISPDLLCWDGSLTKVIRLQVDKPQ
ncbi:serine/threonine-protein kinase, partial [Streptomyces sp. TP-A0356]|uniref:serine/threonine-protein kinase n=1 Tax=Streptomyces sp. TP-A0356 TaxID=1359208 RepID=UPI001F2077F9